VQSISFYGAAETVTGSRHLLNLNGHYVLVDCGLFQGPRALRERNWEDFPVDPSKIECVVLTHAHQDHIGYLPRLMKGGFKGPIYATGATIGLCRISLPDSGRLQEEEARHRNKNQLSKHNPALPLYTEKDAYQVLKQMVRVPYETLQPLPGKAQFRYFPAGHILGSAFAEIYFENGERILMGGDLGRYNTPIIKDPTTIDFAEYLVVESTYGDRVHSDDNVQDKLERIMTETFRNSGVLLVPTFSIGRTQELLYHIHLLQDAGRIPRLPIFIDSPMAASATELYKSAYEEHDEDMVRELNIGHTPLQPANVTFTRDREQSKALNSMSGPFMVIAGSGMCNGGRILHHLSRWLEDPATTVLFTGYQAEGTTGRRILEGEESVFILKREVQVNAKVEKLNALSAHADSNEIMHWLKGFKTPPKKTFIVHGEPPAQAALQARIHSELGWETVIPKQGEMFVLE
jgi:metallo-beta-lactamase family protein